MRDGTIEEIGTAAFPSIEEAYLDVCAAIPETAADLIRKRLNPFRCAFLITDEAGALLTEIPLSDAIEPSERESIPRREYASSQSARLREAAQRTRALCRESRRLSREAQLHLGRSGRAIERATQDRLAHLAPFDP